MSLAVALSVAAGGALGAVLRWLVGALALRLLGPGLPFGTLAVNLLGAFAMGLAAALLLERAGPAAARLAPFLMTGVLGGFTTFSAFALEALTLIERGRAGLALLYMAGSVGLAVLALWAGLALARALA